MQLLQTDGVARTATREPDRAPGPGADPIRHNHHDREVIDMASDIKETDNGDGTKRVQQWADDGELIYDMTVDGDTVYGR